MSDNILNTARIINTTDSSQYIYSHSGTELTRYQLIKNFNANTISTVSMKYNARVLADLSRLASIHLLPKKPEIGCLCLFSIPEDMKDRLTDFFSSENIIEPASIIRSVLNKSVEEGTLGIEDGILISSIRDISDLLEELSSRNMLSVINANKNGHLLFIPVSDSMGYLSDHFIEKKVVFNSHFFLMDLTDLETSFDIMGEPYGLLMIHGEIISPPLYPRAALSIEENGDSRVEVVSIRDITVLLDNEEYKHGKNCTIFIRPEFRTSPKQEGFDIAVVGKRIVGFTDNGGLEIPEAGYIIHLKEKYVPKDMKVKYLSFGDCFAVQTGPPLLISDKVMTDFKQPYFTGEGIKYPPTVFPPGWISGRAARLGFGVNNNKELILIWAEGSKPGMYRPGLDSKGFTLAEFADIGKKFKLKDFINLDGGGSCQVAVNGIRNLKIADRRNSPDEEFERPVPLGLEAEF
jgi:Phosphodiester glycosidase